MTTPNNSDSKNSKNVSGRSITCPRCGRVVERLVGTTSGDRVEPCGHTVDLAYRTARDLRDRRDERPDLSTREAL